MVPRSAPAPVSGTGSTSAAVRASRIGAGCSFGQNVFVGNDVLIGDNCKVQNNVSIYDAVTLEDDVFCGPSMVFTNVYNPRSAVVRKDEYRRTLVKRGATIGANATIVCGVTLGEYAFIAASAVVTRNVPSYALMAGVPARQIGWMSQCGERLDLPLRQRRGGLPRHRAAVSLQGRCGAACARSLAWAASRRRCALRGVPQQRARPLDRDAGKVDHRRLDIQLPATTRSRPHHAHARAHHAAQDPHRRRRLRPHRQEPLRRH
jgi:UDP-2-acetamido-3-amino-2,3-dideoxy-glucuronate N-acetyltransferase